MMKNLFLMLLVGSLAALGSCKKCYECTKTDTVNGTDSLRTYSFEQCNQGKESDGQDLKSALQNYEANGYTCTQK